MIYFLIAGKGHEDYQDVLLRIKKHPFDGPIVAQEALEIYRMGGFLICYTKTIGMVGS